jgi:transketolase
MALAAKLQKKSYKTYILMGDGEMAEGSVWEAAMAASHLKVDNLCGFVDRNRLQVDGFTQNILEIDPLADKWRSFGWSVREIDGHDIGAILNAVSSVPFEKGKPSVIIANTIKGKGLPFAENQIGYHYHDVDEQMVKESLAILKHSE